MSNLVRRNEGMPVQHSPVPFPIATEWPKQEAESFEVSLRDFFRVLLARKWLIASVMATTMIFVLIQVLTTTPTYKSTVKIQIDPESEGLLPYKELFANSGDQETFLQTQVEILRSRALARRVIQHLDLAHSPVFNAEISDGVILDQFTGILSAARGLFSREEERESSLPELQDLEDSMVEKFRQQLEVDPLKQSRLVDVSFISHSPDFAARTVNTLAEEFIEQNFESKFEATQKAASFLQKQLNDLKIAVERSEQELMDYARAKNILNISESESIIKERLAELSRQLTRIEAELIQKTAQYDSVRDATAEDFPESLKNASIVTLEDRINALDQRLASLSIRFGPEWPEIVQIKGEISQVKQQLQQEREKAIERVRLDYELAQKHHAMFMNSILEQKRQANKYSEDSIQYNILKREVESDKQLYEGLLQRLKEAGVSAGLKSSNIRIVDPGEVPRYVHRPQKTFTLLLGLAFSLVAAVLLAFLVEHIDNTLKTPADVEQFLGLPSLGVIPKVGGVLEGHRNDDFEGEKSAAVLRHSRAFARDWEAYRSFRTSILLSHSGQPPQKILITSSFPNEGKTTTVANTGIVLAQTGARTLIVDLDMRKSGLAPALGVRTSKGISSFLSGNSDLASQVLQTTVPNLYMLPSGPIPPNPAELLASMRAKDAIDILALHFKYIVIDSPPILSVTDAQIISPLADGVVMVVHCSKTTRDVARKAGNLLHSVGAHILGVMINKVDSHQLEYYGEYYGRYGEQTQYLEAG